MYYILKRKEREKSGRKNPSEILWKAIGFLPTCMAKVVWLEVLDSFSLSCNTKLILRPSPEGLEDVLATKAAMVSGGTWDWIDACFSSTSFWWPPPAQEDDMLAFPTDCVAMDQRLEDELVAGTKWGTTACELERGWSKEFQAPAALAEPPLMPAEAAP